MDEYIEREAAIKAAEHAWNEWNLAMAAADGNREINLVYKRQELCKAVASVFASAPAADVVPVVHGRWVSNGIPDSILSGCSACGFSCVASSFRYCPNCGARMNGRDDHAVD